MVPLNVPRRELLDGARTGTTDIVRDAFIKAIADGKVVAERVETLWGAEQIEASDTTGAKRSNSVGS